MSREDDNQKDNNNDEVGSNRGFFLENRREMQR